MWKEAVVARFKILYHNMPGGAEEKQSTWDSVAGLRAETWNQDLPDTKQGVLTSRPSWSV
jgi:hypothetical protein